MIDLAQFISCRLVPRSGGADRDQALISKTACASLVRAFTPMREPRECQ
jgi:hypothetical protein